MFVIGRFSGGFCEVADTIGSSECDYTIVRSRPPSTKSYRWRIFSHRLSALVDLKLSIVAAPEQLTASSANQSVSNAY
jgi:hypothetical protein